jgi:hypothetical protein
MGPSSTIVAAAVSERRSMPQGSRSAYVRFLVFFARTIADGGI